MRLTTSSRKAFITTSAVLYRFAFKPICLILFTVFLLLATTANAQQRTIKLLVLNNADSLPLSGATIRLQGDERGYITDVTGQAFLTITKTNPGTLSIESLGFTTQQLTIQNLVSDTSINVYLIQASGSGQLETVTISSLRTNSRIENTPTPVEVLGADEMNEENGIKPGNISSLLGDIAGIQMQQVSASSGNTLARIQGLQGRYTQILKDGMPLFGGLSSNLSIMQIPPLDLKQIEIIKGAASTLYGGDAIGGIINLISKNPTNKQELAVTLNRSTLKENNFNLFASKRHNKIGYTFLASQTIQDPVDVDKDGLSDVARVRSTVIHPKLVFYLSPRSTVTVNYTGTFDQRVGGNMNYFNKGSDTLYHVNNKMQRHTADAKWQYDFSEKNNLVVKFSNSLVHQDLDTKSYSFNANQWIYYSEISYFQKLPSAEWVSGINFNGDHFNNTSPLINSVASYRYNTVGAFTQYTWHATSKFIAEGGLRYDHQSTFGGFLLPRLALMYKFTKQFTARVNSGFGYKTPVLLNYLDAETDLNVFSVVKPLQTELSRGLNADFNFHTVTGNDMDITLNQSFFYTRLNHPVFDSSRTDTKVFLLNADQYMLARGLHTYARLGIEPWEIYLGYVYTDTYKKYDPLHRILPVTPRHNLSTVILFEPSEKWRTGIESSFIAGQEDEYYQPVKNYLLVAAMFQYNLAHFSFVLNGENLLNFKQSKYGPIYDGTINNPVFHKLWAPIDGRVINISVKWSL